MTFFCCSSYLETADKKIEYNEQMIEDEIKTILNQVNPLVMPKYERQKVPYAKMVFESESPEKSEHEKNARKFSITTKQNKSSAILNCYEKELITNFGELKANWLFTQAEMSRQTSESNPPEENDYSDIDSQDSLDEDDIKHIHHRDSSIDIRSSIKLVSMLNSKVTNDKINRSEEEPAFFSHTYENDTAINNLLNETSQKEQNNSDGLDRHKGSKACNLM